MSRLPIAPTVDAAPAAAQPLLQAVNAQLGIVPNLFRLLAASPAALERPAALECVLGLSGALGKGALDAQDPRPHRDHRRRGEWLRLLPVGPRLHRQEPAEAERRRDRRQPLGARSDDAKADAALAFARKVVQAPRPRLRRATCRR